MRNFSDSQKKYLLEILCVVFVALILYLRTVHYDFVWDDDLLIQDNPFFQQAIHWKNIFGAGLWKSSMVGADQNMFYYRPLVTLFYTLEHKLWGFYPGGFHSVNIFLHLLSILLIWVLCFQLKLDRVTRIVSCLFFGIHPAQVSCVAFISCHGDLLVQVFSLLALLFWMKEGKIRWLSLLWIFLAMMSKEAGVVLPLVLILFDWLVLERPIKDFKKFVPLLLWIPYFIFRHLSMDSSIVVHVAWETLMKNQGAYRTLAYISRIIFPIPDSQVAEPISVIAIQNIAMTMAFGLLAGLLFSRSDRLQKFLLAWFFLGTVIIADWSNMGVRFSDQLLYIPMASVSILFGIVAPKNRRGLCLLIPLFLLFALVSNSQLPVWKNDLSFWKNELKFDPGDPGANINYAAKLMQNGQMQEGCERNLYILNHLSKRFDRNDTRLILYNLGNCFLSQPSSTAENYYKEALKASPGFSIARNNLIVTLVKQEKYQEAAEQAKILVQERPEVVNSWLLYSSVLFKLKDYAGSLKASEKANALDPNFVAAKKLMEDARQQLGIKTKS